MPSPRYTTRCYDAARCPISTSTSPSSGSARWAPPWPGRPPLRGLSVAGFDALDPPHSQGSTHGHSRIIREAYFEHPQYVPLVQRAYALWAELEASAGTRLFQACGGLMIGRPGQRPSSTARVARPPNTGCLCRPGRPTR